PSPSSRTPLEQGRPHSGGVLALACDLLVQLRSLALRLAVALRAGLALLRLPACHHPLIAGELLRGALPVLRVGKVVVVGCGGRGLLHAPTGPTRLRARLGSWTTGEAGRCTGSARHPPSSLPSSCPTTY